MIIINLIKSHPEPQETGISSSPWEGIIKRDLGLLDEKTTEKSSVILFIMMFRHGPREKT